MANSTDPGAGSIHGTNPQNLIESILRKRIYNDRYWKEHCFGLTAATLVDRAVELEYIGGTYAGNRRPTPFICLILKMLQIQPDKEIVIEFIKNEDYKYVRLLGAFYLRLTGRALDVYKYLENLYYDFRKVRLRSAEGWTLTHMDEFVDKLLREEFVCDITLPFLQKRELLERTGVLEPRKSVLEGMVDQESDGGEDEAKAAPEEAEAGEVAAPQPALLPATGPQLGGAAGPAATADGEPPVSGSAAPEAEAGAGSGVGKEGRDVEGRGDRRGDSGRARSTSRRSRSRSGDRRRRRRSSRSRSHSSRRRSRRRSHSRDRRRRRSRSRSHGRHRSSRHGSSSRKRRRSRSRSSDSHDRRRRSRTHRHRRRRSRSSSSGRSRSRSRHRRRRRSHSRSRSRSPAKDKRSSGLAPEAATAAAMPSPDAPAAASTQAPTAPTATTADRADGTGGVHKKSKKDKSKKKKKKLFVKGLKLKKKPGSAGADEAGANPNLGVGSVPEDEAGKVAHWNAVRARLGLKQLRE